MLGALIPDQDVAGAKVYTTIDGAFSFAHSPVLDHERRAARHPRRQRHHPAPDRGLLGDRGAVSRPARIADAGASSAPASQGRAHAVQLAKAFPLDAAFSSARSGTSPRSPPKSKPRLGSPDAPRLGRRGARRGRHRRHRVALEDAALFRAKRSGPGPSSPRLDRACRRRARSTTRARPAPAGSPSNGARRASRRRASWFRPRRASCGTTRSSNSGNSSPARRGAHDAEEITVYKSVGVGLEDIAVAGLAWRRIAGG